jgi:hypothetical protein
MKTIRTSYKHGYLAVLCKSKFLLIFISAFTLFNTSELFALDQNYIIYTDQSAIFVKGAINSQNDKKFSEAAEAFEYAINLSPDGGEVSLQPGIYKLNKEVKISNGITLKGSGRGTKLVVTEKNSSGIGVLVQKMRGVRIADLLVTGKENKNSIAGIVFDNAGNCKVDNIAVIGFSQYGLWVKNESFLCDISGSSFAGNMKANIFFDKHRWGEWGDFVPNTVSNCMIFGGGVGIHGFQTTVLNIIGCSFYQNSGTAIRMDEHSYSVLVSGCRTFQIKGDAVLFDGSGEINISSNIFCWHTGHGVIIKNCGWGTVSGNEIIDNGSYNPNVKNRSKMQVEFADSLAQHYGVLLSNARGMNITGNTIFNWPQAGKMKSGVYEDKECYENNISNNIINYFKEEAIVGYGKNSLYLNNVVNANKAYEGKPDEDVIQSFPEEKMERFIELLK